MRDGREKPGRRTGLADGAFVDQSTRKNYEKRSAGQHAITHGRKRAVSWTLVESLAFAVKWKAGERWACAKRREAERTWIKGGEAERWVGEELEGLREHGFYVFHDVRLPEIGNVDHVALGPQGFFGIETKSHGGRVRIRGSELSLNGRSTEKDFVSQTWRGCYALREILGADVTPLLCFTEAFVEGRAFVRGVKVLPLRWLKDEVLKNGKRHDSRAVALAVGALGSATGCYPSAVPRRGP